MNARDFTFLSRSESGVPASPATLVACVLVSAITAAALIWELAARGVFDYRVLFGIAVILGLVRINYIVFRERARLESAAVESARTLLKNLAFLPFLVFCAVVALRG